MKVALLGMAPGWDQAPFGQKGCEIWALNDMYRLLSPTQLASVTRWFELHMNSALTRSRRPRGHWKTLDRLKIPVYTFHPVPIRHRRQLDVRTLRLVSQLAYFTCTFAYQIALALSEGVKELGLYGVHLTGTREALVERPCVEWWLGLAEGRHVKVSVSMPDHYRVGLLRHPYRYALDDPKEREATYALAYKHHVQGIDWLQAEYHRLIATTPRRKRDLIDARRA